MGAVHGGGFLAFMQYKTKVGLVRCVHLYGCWWSKYVKAHFKLEDVLCSEGQFALSLVYVQTFCNLIFVERVQSFVSQNVLLDDNIFL